MEPTVVPNEDEAMPVVEPVIVQGEPSPRKRKKRTGFGAELGRAQLYT